MKGKVYRLAVAVLTMKAVALQAQSYSVVHNFVSAGTGGHQPMAGLVLSGDTLYGTTSRGGTNGDHGAVFSMNVSGSNYTVLHSFDGANGDWPAADLVLSGSTLYGVTQNGGANNTGVAFSIQTNGSGFTVIHHFEAIPGSPANAIAGLVLSGGTLYGTIAGGGANYQGAVFALNTNGTSFDLIHSFNGSDGSIPLSQLVLSSNTLYGTTWAGGEGGGVVFSVETNGANFSVRHSFANDGGQYPEGEAPVAGLALSGGVLFGTTAEGGTNNYGTIFAIEGANFQVIHHFTSEVPNGALWDWGPWHGSPIVSNGNLYGTTQSGGDYDNGTIYSIKTNGTDFRVLHSLRDDPADGAGSFAKLVLATNTVYGTAALGGTQGGGTVFRFRPCSCESPPIITGIALNINSSVTISCSGDPFCTYLMKASTNLVVPMASWLTISTNVAGNNGTWQVTDFIDTNAVYVCSTNYIYGDGGIDPGSNPTNVIGTNISCSYELNTRRFYRAATP